MDKDIQNLTIEMTLFIKRMLEDCDEKVKSNVLCGVFVNTLFHEFDDFERMGEFLNRVMKSLIDFANIINEDHKEENG